MLAYTYEVTCDKCGAMERSGPYVPYSPNDQMFRWYPSTGWVSIQGLYSTEWICPKHKVEITDG